MSSRGLTTLLRTVLFVPVIAIVTGHGPSTQAIAGAQESQAACSCLGFRTSENWDSSPFIWWYESPYPVWDIDHGEFYIQPNWTATWNYQNGRLCGDLDMEVDVRLVDFTAPSSGQRQVGIRVASLDYEPLASVERYVTSDGSCAPNTSRYRFFLGHSTQCDSGVWVATTDTLVSLRLVRLADTIIGYYDDNGWIELGRGVVSPQAVTVGMYSSRSDGQDQLAWFDNFTVMPGSVDTSDVDSDGIVSFCDNCPGISNPGQQDADGDHVGDPCDPCTDLDGDGFGDPGFPANICALDNCLGRKNPGQEDTDGDGHADACDNCPSSFNPGQENSGASGFGDACEICPGLLGGDTSHDGVVTAADIIVLINYNFKGGPSPLPCVAVADLNCNGTVTSSDIIATVGYVFKSGVAPCDPCTRVPNPYACPPS